MFFNRKPKLAAQLWTIRKKAMKKFVRRCLSVETLCSREVFSADIALFSSTPSDGNVASSVATDITLVFNQDVQVGSGSMNIRDSTGTIVQTVAMSDSAKVQVIGNRVSVNPSSDLSPLANYSVEFSSDAIRTLDGYYWGGIQNTTDLNFTTGRIVYAQTRRGNTNTNGSGTSANPYQSLGYATTRAIPGDTIYVSITDSSGNALTSSTQVSIGYDIQSNGTEASPIVIKPNPSASRQYKFTPYNAMQVALSLIHI